MRTWPVVSSRFGVILLGLSVAWMSCTPQEAPSVALIERPSAGNRANHEAESFGPEGGRADFTRVGTVRGTIRFSGDDPPEMKPIDMSKDLACATAEPALTESFVVGADGGVKDVLVWIDAGLDDVERPDAVRARRLTFEKCRFVPHVMVVRSGVEFEVENKDETLHNYHVITRRNGEWNRFLKGLAVDVCRLEKKELEVSVKCDCHPWEHANLHVLDHDWYAVTDAAGNYEISSLPAGRYRLAFVHERKEVSVAARDILIEPGGIVDLGILTTR